MISEDIKEMTNEDLATALKSSGVNVGPITATTRLVYERKLARIQQDTPAVEENEEMEEEQDENLPEYEEKSSERSYDLSTKLTRSVARRLRHGASPPPDISLNQFPESAKTKGKQKQRGKTEKKSSPEEKPTQQFSNSVPEKVSVPNQSFAEMKPPEKTKSLPKTKLKSNIPRSSCSDFANSTVIYPDMKKAPIQRRSFGLSDSFHISPMSSFPEINAKPSSEKEHVNDENIIACKETLEVNEIDADASLDNPQDNDFDHQLTDSPHDSDYDDHSPDHFPIKNFSNPIAEYSPRENFDFHQEMDLSELSFNTDESSQQSEKFGSQIPNRWSAKLPPKDDLNSPLFKKPNVPASRIGQPKSLNKAQRSKKSSSIWKLDPVEEQNIHRGISELRTGLANSSVKYDYLPKAFVEKYGKYMTKSGIDSTNVKNHQSIDSLLFQSHQEQAKSSSSNSVAQVKTEKLTSAYQRFTSPLASKVSGGNIPPSYIGTPGSSQLNTSLTRKPLSSMREEVKFTSLRNSQATSSASATPSTKKKGMSIMVKLFILIVFGLIVWLIYINFESPAVKPLLTSNK